MENQTQSSTKKPVYKKWWFWVIIAVVILIIMSKTSEKKTDTPNSTQPNTTAQNEPNTTKDHQQTTSASSKNPTERSYKIGDVVKFDDSEWIVVSAESKGSSIHSETLQKDATTEGKFIQVIFRVKNLTNKEDRILDTPKLLDSKGREFKEWGELTEAFYIPDNAKILTVTEALPSSMTKEFYGIYEVPSDASGLKFQARALAAFGDKILVDLGL